MYSCHSTVHDVQTHLCSSCMISSCSQTSFIFKSGILMSSRYELFNDMLRSASVANVSTGEVTICLEVDLSTLTFKKKSVVLLFCSHALLVFLLSLLKRLCSVRSDDVLRFATEFLAVMGRVTLSQALELSRATYQENHFILVFFLL